MSEALLGDPTLFDPEACPPPAAPWQSNKDEFKKEEVKEQGEGTGEVKALRHIAAHPLVDQLMSKGFSLFLPPR